MSDLSVAFVKTCDLALRLGFTTLANIEGCWEHKIDDDWVVRFNPHREPCQDSTGGTIPPVTMLVSHRDFPAGAFGPYGGAFFSGAEDDFIAALDKQLALTPVPDHINN